MAEKVAPLPLINLNYDELCNIFNCSLQKIHANLSSKILLKVLLTNTSKNTIINTESVKTART